jgi:hypothetical protein
VLVLVLGLLLVGRVLVVVMERTGRGRIRIPFRRLLGKRGEGEGPVGRSGSCVCRIRIT